MKDWLKPTSLPGPAITLNGSVRYGVSRNVPADGPNGPTKIALVVIERDTGNKDNLAFETIAIPEDKIRFAGESIIENEVRRVMGL